MNTPSWILLGLLIVAVGLALYFYIRGRKKGGCSCCSHSDSCPRCKNRK